MASVLIARPATAPPLLPVHAHDLNHIRNEQPLPINPMSTLPGGRYEQLPHLEPSYSSHEESSTESEATLTPTSDHEQAQGSEEAPRSRLVAPKWNRFLASLPRLPLPRPPVDNSSNNENEIKEDRIKYEKLEDFEEGLPQLAALLDSNESFSIFRRYGAAAARVLLQREIEIGILTEQLYKLDKEDAAPGGKKYRLCSIEHDDKWDAAKKKLIDEIDVKLMGYYERLLKYMEVLASGRPTERDQASVCNWIRNNRPLVEGEDTFILYIEDLVSAKKKVEANSQKVNRLEELLDSWSCTWSGAFLNRYLQAKNGKKRTDNPHIHHRSAENLATLARIIIIVLAVNFLLIPVFILFLVQMTRPSMTLVVLAFVLAFAIVLGGPVQAKAQEVLIGTSAYGAFLVTFLGNMNTGSAIGIKSQ